LVLGEVHAWILRWATVMGVPAGESFQ
jgi:hypothetical protein